MTNRAGHRGAVLILAILGLGVSACAREGNVALGSPAAAAPEAVAADRAAADPSAQRAELVDHDAGEGDPDEDEEHGEPLEDDHEEGDSVDIFACLDRTVNSPPDCPQFTISSPLTGLAAAEIERKVKTELASLGSITIGPPNRGRLFNGVRMPDGERWRLTDPGNAYGTQETVDSIVRAIDKVHEEFPGSPQVIIGHLSAKNGGRLRPHKSHQSGRDVDLSYFYVGEKQTWFAVANNKNLDKARSWAFVRAFALDPNVEMILIDTSIQRLLRDYALSQGEDREFVEKIFQVSGKNPRPLIRHVRGHATHIHVRFFSPNALATGRLAEPYLPKPPPEPKREGRPGKHNVDHAKRGPGKEPPEEDYILHRARSGDTLDSLARRYGVTVQQIKAANGLRSNAIKEKKTYRIPKTASSSSLPSKRQRK